MTRKHVDTIVNVSLADPDRDYDEGVRFLDHDFRLLRLGTGGDVEAATELVRKWSREAAAVAWCRWEDAHVATATNAQPNPRYDDARFRLGFARQVTHCWRNNSWLAPDEIVDHAGRLAGIPGWLIHGRLDVSSPLDAPWRIHQAWPGSQLLVVDDEGHGGSAMAKHWRDRLADQIGGAVAQAQIELDIGIAGVELMQGGDDHRDRQ